MTRPHDSAAAAATHYNVAHRPVSPSRPSTRPATSLMRKYEVSSLMSDGTLRSSHHIAPATPLFENAASAFARGTLISTDQGPIAIEDLMPGDHVETVDGAPQVVRWIGSTMMVPSAPGQTERMKRLVRIMSDSLGIGRPMPDLLLGPGARLLREKPAYGRLLGSEKLFMPIDDFIDALGLIEITPPSPVRVYHLALDRHASIRAAGIEVETYHPGETAEKGLGDNMRNLFLSLFPHIHEMADFGPLTYPRASLDTLEGMSAA